ncbi:leucine-rich repeat protein [Butyrivibrio sp. WCD3002]|uniref:leucine-rich repeat protein n=1 Tax=Butyrivibrio sp. WCD3002 TaxID=1280676 RepID=UPI0004175104|nr:leucine-rich repeat protein [Butyrivibrio sp. WCD3002]
MSKRVIKKVISMVTALTLASGISGNIIPLQSDIVAKAESIVPAISEYATAEQMMSDSFSLNEASKVKRVVFGGPINPSLERNKTIWAIAGTDKGIAKKNIVMLTAKGNFGDPSMNYTYPFEDNVLKENSSVQSGYQTCFNNDPDRNRRLMSCTTAGPVQKVLASHYGASDLRNYFVKLASDLNYFTADEQQLMIPVTVTTRDVYNNCNYTTTDKLYAPTVGENLAGTSRSRLTKFYVGTHDDIECDIVEEKAKSGNTVYGAYNDFYTRTSGYFLSSVKGGGDTVWAGNDYGFESEGTNKGRVDMPYAGSTNTNAMRPTPVLTLDARALLFGSVARCDGGTAAGNGYTIDDRFYPFTLRFYDNSKIASKFTYTSNKVTMTKGADSGNTSLYIQGKSGNTVWYYSVSVKNAEITAEEVMTKVNAAEDGILTAPPSFTNCKLWLETTNISNHITYAKYAEGTSYPKDIHNLSDVFKNDSENDSAQETIPAKDAGTVITGASSQFVVTDADSVKYKASTNKKATKITVPDEVTDENGHVYKVTAIDKNAFKNSKKAKSIVTGKYVVRIYKGAFKGCKNVKTITLNANTLKTIDKGAFSGLNGVTFIIKAKDKKTAQALFKKITGKGGAKNAKMKFKKSKT